MRHKKSHSLNNRFTSWRKATLLSLLRSVLINQSIRTTKIRATSAQPLVEKLISLAKEDTLAARRSAYRMLADHKLVHLLFSDIGPRFKNRSGGYTRILNLGFRRGDGSDIALLELTEITKKEIKRHKKPKEAKPEEEKHPEAQETEPIEEKKTRVALKEEKPPMTKKPSKKFLGGLRGIFKKERDSL
ncbi:MAG: 50S ribosomal protein L17 [Deltaproteobacteria bacterium]